jgi:predicted nucleic acid-binding protein
MEKIFLDTDVILDLLSKRQPFYENSYKLFSLIDRNKIKAYTSPVIFANIHYILSKQLSKQIALQNLIKLRKFVNIVPINEEVIDLSLKSNFTDYEDSIQYYAALLSEISILITRNIKDYKNAKIAVSTPEEYLKMRLAQGKSV